MYCIVLCCIVLYCIVFYFVVLYCIVLYSIVLCCIVLYCIVLYCIVLYCIVLYCIVLYCIVLFYIFLDTSIISVCTIGLFEHHSTYRSNTYRFYGVDVKKTIPYLHYISLFLVGLDNIRKASMFPRDPNRCHP